VPLHLDHEVDAMKQRRLRTALTIAGVALFAIGSSLIIRADAIQHFASASIYLSRVVHASPQDLAILERRTGIILAITGVVVAAIRYFLPADSGQRRMKRNQRRAHNYERPPHNA
jgi:uncharacterized BrkB/YihY/UPF0761 family membrane protein